MTVDADKGNPLTMPEVEAEPEIDVVTYDEEQPVEAVPVIVEHVQPLTASDPSSLPPSTMTSNQQSQQHYDDEWPHNDSGCDCVLCGDTRVRRIAPGFNLSMALCGDTYIDIHDSFYPPESKITLLNIRMCGNTHLCVPPGTRVVVRRLLLCGNRDIHIDPNPNVEQGSPPRITLTIFSLCGDVRVRSDPDEMTNKFRLEFNFGRV